MNYDYDRYLLNRSLGNCAYFALVGDCFDLNAGLKRYKLEGDLKGLVDFSDVIEIPISGQFVSGIIINPPFTNLQVLRDNNQITGPNTTLISFGLNRHPRQLLYGFVKALDLVPRPVGNLKQRLIENATPITRSFRFFAAPTIATVSEQHNQYKTGTLEPTMEI